MKSRLLPLAFALPTLVLLFPVGGCVSPAERAPDMSTASITQQGPTQARPLRANVDPKYAPDALKSAFSTACQKAGFRIRELAVDESELPFLLYGVMDGERDLAPVQQAVSTIVGYRYAGSWTKRGNGLTIFAMDITQGGQSPATFARLQKLVDLAPR